MKRYVIFSLTAAALGAAAFAPVEASARSGGHGLGNHGFGSHGSVSTMRQQPKIDRPTLNFTRMKLLKCHKYGRGNGQGGVNWVTSCS